MGQENIALIIILLIVIIMTAGGYFVFSKKSTTPTGTQTQQTTQQINTSDWKTYKNEKYGFEIKYPSNLEPLEGQALFYRPPEFSPLLNVCFASVNRLKFYCEAELYIAPSFVASPQNLKFLSVNSFLGLNRCAEKGLRPQPKFDNIQGSEVDICGEKGMYRNVFVTKGSFLYLFSTEPSVGYTTGKDTMFEEMIKSFRFINL